MTALTTYTHNGLSFVIHAGESAAAERDIIAEVQTAYEWDFPINTAIDVGAHIGAWTKYAKHLNRSAQIIAVEVDPLNYALLMPNVINVPGVQPLLRRVGYVPTDFPSGLYRIVRNPHNTGSTYTALIDTTLPLASHDRAPANVTIEALMRQHGWQSLDVLKLDCEGAEVEILNHITDDCLSKIKRIVGEIHTTPETFNYAIEGRLFKAGFRMVFQQHPGDATLFYMHAWKDGVQ